MDKEKVYQCHLCDKQFQYRSNMQRHFKSVHQDGNSFSCTVCSKIFTSKYNLERHTKTTHITQVVENDYFKCAHCCYQTTSKANFKRHTIRHDKPVKKTFSCAKCNKKFFLEKNLKIHDNKIHSVLKTGTTRKCPLCDYVSKAKKSYEMHCHFEKIHNINIDRKLLKFETIEEFHAWKDNLEKRTIASFNKKVSTKTSIIFRCHRSGFYKAPSKRKRYLKMSGSSKINGYCPATIIMNHKNGNINVNYVSTHIGHKNEWKYIRLTKNEKKMIALQLENKRPHLDILQSIRNSLSNHELERIHLTNRKDIENIEKSFNLQDDSMKHPYDPVSVMAWVSEMKQSMPVIGYKPQGVVDSIEFPEFDKNDFLLIFMTQSQKSFLEQNSETICIDGTHGLNNYGFQLFTLLAIDDTREGFPVAFMICNRADEVAITTFFKFVKIALGPIQPKVFMSDMDETFYSAWKNVMGNPAHRIFCTWHVLKAWKNNIRKKVKSQEKRIEVEKVLRTLIYELDVNTFEQLLPKVLTKLDEDNDTTAFKEYFYNHYVRNERYITWAYCYRCHLGINTNMYIENFNKILKYFYLKGKHVRRLDKTLLAILQLINDKLFDFLIKMTRGKLVKKLQVLRKNHAKGIAIQEQHVVKAESSWQVLSSTGTEIYSVVRVKNCKTCKLLCLHCNSCFHEYLCSCMDSSIKNNMCKHIHAVARTNNGYENTPTTMIAPNDSTMQSVGSLKKDILQEIIKKPSKANNAQMLIEQFSSIANENSNDNNVMIYLTKQLNKIAITVDAIKSTTQSHSTLKVCIKKIYCNIFSNSLNQKL